ncbi:MAG: hypothetical protein ACQEWU_18845 [Bacillota bacterium]
MYCRSFGLFIPPITGSKTPASGNKGKPLLVSGGSTASTCPIGSKAFRSYPFGTNNPWGINKTPTDGGFTLFITLAVMLKGLSKVMISCNQHMV